MSKRKMEKKEAGFSIPSTEEVQAELAKATSMDDFFGKEGILARLFSQTMQEMLEAELDEQLGYERYESKGRNSGNSRNGHYSKTVRTSNGEVELEIPRDRNGEYNPQILPKYVRNTNELEDKILGMYARGVSTRDIQDSLGEMYGVNVSPGFISKVTDKIWDQVEAGQNRPLEAVYPIIHLDALNLKLRLDGKVLNTAVHIVLGVDLSGKRDVLGQWVAKGGESANFWLSVMTDLQQRGVKDIFIATMDGLTGFSDAVHAVFPHTEIQRCIIHQIRNSLRYVTWMDRKEFAKDLKLVYQAPNRETAESELQHLQDKWHDKYAVAVRSWQSNWDELSTFFDYPAEIRRLIYTNNAIEAYNRQLRKVIKTKSVFPTEQAVRKLLYLVNHHIIKKWTRPLKHWPLILNQLAIRFEGRLPI